MRWRPPKIPGKHTKTEETQQKQNTYCYFLHLVLWLWYIHIQCNCTSYLKEQIRTTCLHLSCIFLNLQFSNCKISIDKAASLSAQLSYIAKDTTHRIHVWYVGPTFG